MKRIGRLVVRGVRGALLAGGVAFFLQVGSAWSNLPFRMDRWLSHAGPEPSGPPRYVIVLGGGGIPSESGLIRTYYAARCGASTSGAVFVVSLPTDTDPENSSVGRMRDELVMRGIPPASILMECQALNTHQQAANIRKLLGEAAGHEAVLIVTSPTHVRRALLCFRKEGFMRVSGLPAFNTEADADAGEGVKIRYAFWSAMETQTRCLREFVALAYYRIRGWL
jgi:uncharacterized SAM-binding protein YcdF (DUF218 family)